MQFEGLALQFIATLTRRGIIIGEEHRTSCSYSVTYDPPGIKTSPANFVVKGESVQNRRYSGLG